MGRLVGKKVRIKQAANPAFVGEWGVVSAVFADDYYVALWGDKRFLIELERHSFSVMRRQETITA